MSKKLKDILAGVKSSKISDGSLGEKPGIDYQPKSGDEQKFVGMHKTEKHAHRSGNKDDVFNAANIKYSMDDPKMKNFGHKKGKDEIVSEAKEVEEAKCNESAKGVSCPVHGMAECMSSKKINEISAETAKRAATKATYRGNDATEMGDRDSAEKNYKKADKFNAYAKKKMKEEVELDEVLTKKDPAGKWIHDFVHSDNPKFAGKSKKERTKQALAAYYAKQRNEAVEPLLGSANSDSGADMVKTELKALADKANHLVTSMPDNMHVEPWVQAKIAQAKEMVSSVHDYMIYGDHQEEDESAPADTPMTFPSMNVDTARI